MRLFLSICTQLKGVSVFLTNFMSSLCATKFKTQKQKEDQGKNTMNKPFQNCGKEKGNSRIYLKVNKIDLPTIVGSKSQTKTRVSSTKQ